MDNQGHIQGGYLDDETDDVDFDNILLGVVLLGFMFFDPRFNRVPRRRRVRDSVLSGRDYVLELINGHEDRIIENMRLDVPQFLMLCDLLVQRGYWHAYPSHQDCVGALDGTHVSAWCSSEIRERFINRHGDLSQNVLAACDHDMRFVYVRVGWEGSAHDARILQDTLLDPNSGFPMPPPGKNYVVDAAYRNMPGFVAPFRGAQGTQHERAAKRLFNRRHASVRNIIERTFGVLKKRFPILKGPMQNYLIATQNNIVLACCILHNFMRAYSPADEYFNEEATLGAIADAQIAGEQQQAGQPIDMSEQGIFNWNEDRRAMAAHMYWNAHN
ncbi:protein ANTAGONIST OF LIKE HETEROCHROMATIN PROTEIN 1-like [Coffea arabica]|uniref:Protein ANTAGONIST OF LIKE HETEROCHROMATIN PROTEIN 1-like n=1 Tax=Coffea arabica TaxID=13443 RepID=A0ABM4UEL3_COFAR